MLLFSLSKYLNEGGRWAPPGGRWQTHQWPPCGANCNEVAEEVIKALNEANKVVLDQCAGDLKQELGELKDGEEEGKAQKSLEKLAYWMDKGLQIYSTLNAPQEIKDLFPEQEDTSILTDNIQKLLETKREEM